MRRRRPVSIYGLPRWAGSSNVSQIIQIILRILGVVNQIAAIVGVVQGSTAKAAQENSPFEIDTATQEILAIVEDSTFGNQALRNTVDTNATLATAQYDDLVARLDAVQQGGSPVTLPTTPPAGYGGSLDASTVWAYPLGIGSIAAGDLAIAAGGNAIFESNAQVGKRVFYPGGWYITGAWSFAGQTNPDVNWPPVLDPTTILLGDATVGAWLAREYGFTPDGYSAGGYPYTNQPLSSWQWVYWLGDAEFAEYKWARFGAVGSLPPLPPIWPGIDNIITGSTVALVDQLRIAGPLDGCTVFIDAVPSRFGQFDFPDYPSYVHAGALAFQSDEAGYEAPQNLGFQRALYLPKSMAHAEAVGFRVAAGVTGFVTPFVLA
jgi:hypothetical protein